MRQTQILSDSLSVVLLPAPQAKKREELFDAQKKLEERLRQEEDELFKSFHQERQQAKTVITKEIDQEWEQRLRELTEKYDLNDKKKNKKIKDQDKKVSGGESIMVWVWQCFDFLFRFDSDLISFLFWE